MKPTGIVLIALLVSSTSQVFAQSSLMHPQFRFLDSDGKHVLESGKPVSTMRTCGNCHDTDFIASHSFHSDVGLQNIGPAGQTASGRPRDTSPGRSADGIRSFTGT